MSLGEPVRRTGRSKSLVHCCICAFVLGCSCGSPAWAARSTAEGVRAKERRSAEKRTAALSPWEEAEQGRDALEQIPDTDRTRADYMRAMDLYRAIYHGNPADAHAASAVFSVAELLAEQGRSLHDPKSFKQALGQYEFLRKQYPGSSLRVQALLNEGQIEQNDLNDSVAARETYRQLLKDYPKSEHADEARAALASLEQPSVGSSHASSAAPVVARTSPITEAPAPQERVAHAAQGSSLPPMALTSGATPSQDDRHLRGVVSSQVPQASSVDRALIDEQTKPEAVSAAVVRHRGKRAVVAGIRHWSTLTYTRVAIDLGDKVTYEAARVPNPDRIYFDLHGTRLAQDLVGKSFNVTDDGFLKRVRAAQYSDDVTRVVLDVNDVTEYSAFLLPDPYRLIIDIHGAKPSSAPVQVAGNHTPAATTSMPEVPAPHAAAAQNVTPGKPVPNSVATRSSSADVVDISQMPGRVDATRRPTSRPISAVVSGKSLAQESEAPSAPSTGDLASADVPPAPAVGSTSDSSAATHTRTRRSRNRTSAQGAPVSEATPARAAAPMADGETSLVRALGLKIGRIVIDAGHGGHDSGTLGVGGIEEKDVVLDVALRLGKLLHDRLGAEIIYTRSDDTFIPLETRTAIANKAQADLFISIHANSSRDASARGVEVYYLNFTSDPTALDVAARENAVSDESIHQLSDLVKKIALKDKIAESREFASDVESSLYAGLQKGNTGLKDRGVKKAPFVVLIGANMPSILAEISFVTNPKDAAELRDPEYRERVAESLYRGVARYEGGLSGTHIATERASVGQ